VLGLVLTRRGLHQPCSATLRRARLVLGWVTVTGVQLPVQKTYVTSHLVQLSLAIPLWVGAMSTSDSVMEEDVVAVCAVTRQGCMMAAGVLT